MYTQQCIENIKKKKIYVNTSIPAYSKIKVEGANYVKLDKYIFSGKVSGLLSY